MQCRSICNSRVGHLRKGGAGVAVEACEAGASDGAAAEDGGEAIGCQRAYVGCRLQGFNGRTHGEFGQGGCCRRRKCLRAVVWADVGADVAAVDALSGGGTGGAVGEVAAVLDGQVGEAAAGVEGGAVGVESFSGTCAQAGSATQA